MHRVRTLALNDFAAKSWGDIRPVVRTDISCVWRPMLQRAPYFGTLYFGKKHNSNIKAIDINCYKYVFFKKSHCNVYSRTHLIHSRNVRKKFADCVWPASHTHIIHIPRSMLKTVISPRTTLTTIYISTHKQHSATSYIRSDWYCVFCISSPIVPAEEYITRFWFA